MKFIAVQELNATRWNRFITRLMIDSLDERCTPQKGDRKSDPRLVKINGPLHIRLPMFSAIKRLPLSEVRQIELDRFDEEEEEEEEEMIRRKYNTP
jgi:hypothetical protein